MFNFLKYLLAQSVKKPPAMQKTHVRPLGREDPPEKRMAAHSSVLAWRIPWTEEPGRLQSIRVAKNQTQLKQLSTHAAVTVSLTRLLRVSMGKVKGRIGKDI